jgi:hypothetical protein
LNSMYSKMIPKILIFCMLAWIMLPGALVVHAAELSGITPNEATVGYSGQLDVTIIGTGTSFDQDTTVIRLMQGATEIVGGVVPGSVIVNSTTSISLKLKNGLTAGNYDVQVSTPAMTDTIGFSVVQPTIALGTTNVPAGYSSNIAISVTGTNTHFVNGTTVVELFNGSTKVNGATTNVSVTSGTSLSFDLVSKPGGIALAVGTYSVKITTGAESSNADLVVYSAGVDSLSPAVLPLGYSNGTIQVTGTNTNFGATTSAALLDGTTVIADGIVGGSLQVTDADTVSLRVKTGLTAKTYTVRLTTGQEVVSGSLTVYQSSVTDPENLANGRKKPVGYTTQTVTVNAVSTNFADGQTTVQLMEADGVTPVASGIVGSPTVVDADTVRFSIKTELGAGSYVARISTTVGNNAEVVTASVQVYQPSITLSKSSAAVGSSPTITVSGTNTNFVDGTTTVALSGQPGKTSNVVVNGVNEVVFDLDLGGVSSGTYQITVTTGEEVATANFLAKSNTEPAKLSFSTNSQSVTADVYSGNIIIQLLTVNGTLVNTSAVTQDVPINLSSNSNSGEFYFNDTVTNSVYVPSGQNSVTIKYKDTKAGTHTISATSTGLESASQAITVNAGEPSELSLSTENTTASVDSRIKGSVSFLDSFGNNSTVTRDVYLSGTGVKFYTAAEGGTVTESVYLNDATVGEFWIGATTPGTYEISVTDDVYSDSANVTFTAGALSQFDISLSEYSPDSGETVTASVYAKDQHGNVITGYRGKIKFSLLNGTDPEAILPNDYTFQAADNGFKQFNVTFNTAGKHELIVTDSAAAVTSGDGQQVTVPLVVQELTPAAGAINVPLIATIGVLFNSSDLQAAASTVTASVYNTVTGNVYGFTTIFAGNGLYFNDLVLVDGETTYTITIDAGQIETVTGVVYGDPIQWSFTTVADGTAPSVVTNLQVTAGNGKLDLNWDNPVDADRADIKIYYRVGLGDWTAIDNSELTKDSSTYTISGLTNGTTYTVKVVTVDGSGNESSGVIGSGKPYDTSKPVVSERTPASGATNVAITSNIVITFSKEMDSTTINSTNIKLLLGETEVPAGISYNSTLKQATINPNADLTYDSVYTVNLTGGIKDSFGIAMNADSWQFATAEEPVVEDTEAPAAPTGLTATAGNGQVTLSWTANTESDLYGYYVYVNGSEMHHNTDRIVGTSYTVGSLTNGTQYSFVVTAVDNSGNESPSSAAVTATPVAPTNNDDDDDDDNQNPGSQNPGNQNPGNQSPGNQNPGNNQGGNQTPPADDEAVIVNEPVADQQGRVAVTIAEGKKEVLLPAQAAQNIGSGKTLELKSEEFTAEIPGDVLAELQALVGNDQDAQISFKFDQVTAEETTELLEKANSNASQNKADVKSAGEVFVFTLSVIDKDGQEKKLTKFIKPVKLTLKYKADANKDLLGVYFIGDNGELEFVGGTIEGDTVVGYASHFSKYAVLEYNKSFDDVPSSYWAHDVIKKMAAKHILFGVSASEYLPKKNVTRAEFAAFIVRVLGLQATEEVKFADVDKNKWYASAVAAANQAGVVSGRSETIFAPEDEITREEMAVMVMRAYEIKVSNKLYSTVTSTFADRDQISPWAKEYVDMLSEYGFSEGRGNNLYAPKGVTNRAEAAQIISILFDK